MKPSDRQKQILKVIRADGEGTVDAFAELLGTSRETVRRDIAALIDRGLVEKIHGGARRPRRTLEPAFEARLSLNAAAKQAIAAKAASLLSNDESVFIDTGSTTLFFAEELAETCSVYAITNSIVIASVLADGNKPSDVMLLGGVFNAADRQTVGHHALEQINTFRPNHAFITVGALSDVGGLMDFNTSEAAIARAMIKQASKVTVLVDASKYDESALFKVAALSEIDRIVCDQPPQGTLATALEEAEVEVLVAEPASKAIPLVQSKRKR